MLRAIIHRLALGLMVGAGLFVLADIVVMVLWFAHLFTNGTQEMPTMAHIVSPETLAWFGVGGALVGTVAAKTASSVLLMVCNGLMTAAEWCTAYGTKKRTSDSDKK